MSARRHRYAVTSILALVVGGWACEEAGLSHMSDALQHRWDCWAEQTQASTACAPQRHLAHDDADWCQSAVAACHARGEDVAVETAEANWRRWQMAGAALRVLALLASVALMFSFGGRWLQRQPSPRGRSDQAS